MKYWAKRRADLMVGDGGQWRDYGRASLEAVKIHWWQLGEWRHAVARIRHWWIFKIRVPLHKTWKIRNWGIPHWEINPPIEGARFKSCNEVPLDLGSPAPILESSKEWIPTLLPGDTLEGIAQISAERKAKGLRDGAAADGR